MEKWVDLRSDTVTQPTLEMRKAMFDAPVGDDVYQDDPSINKLEKMAAEIIGKQAAVFVPSGTMGNQLAIMTHTTPGDEIIAGRNCHIVHYEAGAPGRISGVNLSLADHHDNYVTGEHILRLMRPPNDSHFPKTSLVCVENALTNGDVVPLTVLQDTYKTAKQQGILVHLDGARIFNAAVSLGMSAKEIADCADSVMFCISKGLCAPVGSLLCGTSKFIERARFNRKILGGGMRQAGVLAACGIVSLEKMIERLPEDHANAKYLAKRLNTVEGVSADEDRVKINMVFWKTNNPKFKSDDFVSYMGKNGIKVYGILVDEYRFVVHNDITRKDIDYVIELIGNFIKSIS